MMSFRVLCPIALFALPILILGCGGGSGDTEEEGTITRTMLVGPGDNSTQTAKSWREVLVKVSSGYPGAGADQACPVQLDGAAGQSFFACNPLNSREMRSDGKWRFTFETAPPDAFISDWTLTGNTLVLVSRGESGSSSTATYTLQDEGVVAGKQRIRMSLTSVTPSDSTKPSLVGFQFIIEEV